MSTEVENSAAADAPAVAADDSAPNSAPTSPATAASKTPFKKGVKKVAEKTDEYLLARFQGDGVRYKAKLIGVDDVPEARGDKMSQDSMMKLKGMAVAARSQGKHKQRIWVNISMSGLKIIDEKSGVIEHEHIVNKISFIARDVTDNRAFGYVCGAEGQHQFFAIKTAQQAEPLVIDLKDLFQVIFNQRKKEAEASQKGENSSVVENGSDALLSVDAGQTAKPVEQLDLFGDMSTPPDMHAPTSTNNDLFGADLFAAPGQTDGSSEAVDSLFNSTPASTVASSITALGNLQLGPTSTSSGLWGAPTSLHSMFPSMPGVGSPVSLPGPQPAFPQPSAFGGLPIPPGVWAQQAQFGAPPISQPQLWGHPPPQVGPMGAAAPGWGQPPPAAANPFQPSHFPMMGELHHQGPPRPPPRPPAKEAPPKVENSAFTALDPLGEKEKKTGKDMFKDFQIAKPPAIPARKGEAGMGAAPSTNGGGAFDQYFSNKVGVPQDVADHDDFDINQMPVVVNDAPAAVPAPSLNAGLLDAAFSPAPAAPAPSQGFNQSMFDEAFGAPPAAMSSPAVQTSGSSDPFGDPFGNPFA